MNAKKQTTTTTTKTQTKPNQPQRKPLTKSVHCASNRNNKSNSFVTSCQASNTQRKGESVQ